MITLKYVPRLRGLQLSDGLKVVCLWFQPVQGKSIFISLQQRHACNCKYTCYLNGPRYLDFVNYHIAVPQFTNSVSIRQKGQNNYSDAAGAKALSNLMDPLTSLWSTHQQVVSKNFIISL